MGGAGPRRKGCFHGAGRERSCRVINNHLNRLRYEAPSLSDESSNSSLAICRSCSSKPFGKVE